VVFNTKLKNYFEKYNKIPSYLISIILTLFIAVILGSVIFGINFIPDKISGIVESLIHPFATDRFSLTVAENRMPYFGEWAGSFGILFFWLFFFGSIALFIYMTRIFEMRERVILSLGYSIFLICLIFSRYSPSGLLNGENFISNLVYFGGMIILVFSFGYCYYKYYKTEQMEKLKGLDFGLILLFSLFFFSLISARGGVRLIMMLVPPISIITGFFIVWIYIAAKKIKDDLLRLIMLVLVVLVIAAALYSAFGYYQSSNSQAEGFVPSVYTQQWQKAMSWVRDNTDENAVFAHWWDYGYWVQSIGNRATVTDGGNAIVYWNYMMGRYTLTGKDDFQAVDFLYSHNASYYLIDSSDIGKYPAFSCIGSDLSGDRYSWIQTFERDNQQSYETKNTTVYIYTGGTTLDGDIMYNQNGTNIFLPGRKAGIGGIQIARSADGVVSQPVGIYVYQNKQYQIPLRYAYADDKLIDFGTGLEAGVFLMPRVLQGNGGGANIEKDGALLYLSSKTVKSQVARLYLYEEQNQYYTLAHTEEDYVVSQVKAGVAGQNMAVKDFVYFNGFRGPIKIWKINYPSNMKVKEEYLLTSYPDPALRWTAC